MTDVPLPAHSLAEAKLYLLANACPTCSRGPVRTMSRSTGPAGQGESELTLVARCDACGYQFDQSFRIVPDSASDSPSAINPTDDRSQIIDLAQWLTLATMLMESARQEPDKVIARQLRVEAGLCLDEALKFFDDPGNELPPPDAFFTDATRSARREHPDRFSRQRLRAMRLDLPTSRGG